MRTLIQTIITLSVILAGPVSGQSPDTSPALSETESVLDDEFTIPADGEVAARIDADIGQLASPSYQRREAATERLSAIGPPAFAQLRMAYHDNDELEFRLRVEHVVHTAYLKHHVYDKNGFLGISQGPNPVLHADDQRIPENGFGVEVRQVIENTAAEAAGLKKGDVIAALDGEPLAAEGTRPPVAFGESIRVRGPGATVTLTVLRGRQSFEVAVSLGSRPRRYYGATQGLVHRMLLDARGEFDRWWAERFRRPRTEPSQGRHP